MQLNQSRLLDLFAQEFRRSTLTNFLSNMRALHALFCAKICFAAASLSTAWIQLSAAGGLDADEFGWQKNLSAQAGTR
jgi:hypothetical protein